MPLHSPANSSRSGELNDWDAKGDEPHRINDHLLDFPPHECPHECLEADHFLWLFESFSKGKEESHISSIHSRMRESQDLIVLCHGDSQFGEVGLMRTCKSNQS